MTSPMSLVDLSSSRAAAGWAMPASGIAPSPPLHASKCSSRLETVWEMSGLDSTSFSMFSWSCAAPCSRSPTGRDRSANLASEVSSAEEAAG